MAVLVPADVQLRLPFPGLGRFVQQLRPPDLHHAGAGYPGGPAAEAGMADQGADAEVDLLRQLYLAQLVRVVPGIPARAMGRLSGVVAALADRVHAGGRGLHDVRRQEGLGGQEETVCQVLLLDGVGSGHGFLHKPENRACTVMYHESSLLASRESTSGKPAGSRPGQARPGEKTLEARTDRLIRPNAARTCPYRRPGVCFV